MLFVRTICYSLYISNYEKNSLNDGKRGNELRIELQREEAEKKYDLMATIRNDET